MDKNAVIEKVRAALRDKVDPILAGHFGGAELTRVEDSVAFVKMTGGCAGCPAAQMTLEGIIKEQVMSEVPEIEDVKLDNAISEELLDEARKILARQN